MRVQIEQALQNILGLPLWSMGRAGDLEWFAFGDTRRVVVDRNKVAKTVSEYALHVQCAWRFREQMRIIVASNDRFYPPAEYTYEDLLKFDWDRPGANRLDKRVTELIEGTAAIPTKVISFSADDIGGFQLQFDRHYLLEVFPDNSDSSEHWRLFQPYTERGHFVVTSHGIENQ